MLRRRQPGYVNSRFLPPGGASPRPRDPFLRASFALGDKLAKAGGSRPGRLDTQPMLAPVSRLIAINTLSPVLVVQQNPQRVKLRIPNTTGALLFISYTPDDKQGIPVPNNQSYVETNGDCVFTDIYVRCNITGVTVTAYEYFRVPAVKGGS